MSGRNGRLLKWLKGLSYALLALAVAHAGLTLWAGRKLERGLDALRRAGQPVALSDLAGPDIPPERNAFTWLRKAAGLMQSIPDADRLREDAQAALGPEAPDWSRVERALSALASVEELIYRALDCPEARMPVDWSTRSVWQLVFPDFANLREFARILAARSALALHRGDAEESLRSATAILKLSECLRDEPFLIAQLVRYAIISIGAQRMDIVLSGPARLSEARLRRAHDAVAAMDVSDSLAIAMKGERVLLLAGMAEARRGPRAVAEMTGGAGGGAEPPAPPRGAAPPAGDGAAGRLAAVSEAESGHVPQAADGLLKRLLDRILGYGLAPWLYLDQVYYIEFTKRQMQALNAPLPERAKLLAEADRSLTSAPPYAIFTRMLAPAVERASNVSLTAEAALEGCKGLLAIAAFRARTGHPPDSLEQVCRAFGIQVPHDPFTGGPLLYRREGALFLLYSIGEDLKDDGGKPMQRTGAGRSGDLVWGSAVRMR